MPINTANQGIPLPAEGDEPDIPADLNTMALFLEKQLIGFYSDVSDRNTRATSPKEGQIAYTRDTNTFYMYDGAAWQQMYISIGTPPPNITSGTGAPSGGANGDVYLKV